jgi:outer membrane receptor protein involved in Fe transport
MNKHLLRTSFSALCALAPFSLPAAAQETGAAAAEEDEVVVVTARRRAEQLREVPGSVTAITEADREALVLDRMDDYLRQSQSTTLVASGPEYLNDITIRGQGSGRVGFTETATGLYRDGVYNAGGGFGGRTLSRLDLFDTSRVEVLRGPQGALFGRNAVGGVINVIPNGPGDDFEARLTGRYADPERSDVEVVLNVPLAETFAVRLGGFLTDQDEGFIFNTTTGAFIDQQTVGGARITAEARPTETVRIGASVEYFDGETPAFTGLARNPILDPEPYVRANQNRVGVTNVIERALTLSADFDLGWADLALRAARRERDGGRTNEDDDHFAGQSLTDVVSGAPVAFPDYSRAQFELYARDIYQAILTSRGQSRLRWLIGAEALDSTDEVNTEPLLCPTYTGAAQPDTPGCFVGNAGVLAGASLTARNGGRRTMNNDRFIEDLNSISVFGSIDYDLTERLLLGLEMRVQHDERDYQFRRFSEDPLVYFGSGPIPAGLLAPLGGSGVNTTQFCPPTLVGPACAPGNETAEIASQQDNTFYTPTATLRWNFAEEQYAYLRFATGYRSGGFNTNLPPTTIRSALAAALTYDAEYAYNYEAGWKGEFFGFNAEAAIFYTWTNDVQVVTAPALGAPGFVLSNAGDAHVYGFEAEARRTFDLGPGRLSARLAFATLDGEFEEGASLINQGVVVDLEGLQVPRLRDYQVTANLFYTHPIGSLRGFVGVSGQFAEGGFDNPDNTREYQGYELYDARLGLEGGHWRFSLFGRNLTDERYVLNEVSTNEFWSQPRVYGAELALRY